MARRLLTTEDLVADVRQQLDEENTDTLETEGDILPALNRAQDLAVEFLSYHYEEPFLRELTIPLVATQTDYDIPEDALSDRILKVDVNVQSSRYFHPLENLSYRQLAEYEYDGLISQIPNYYTVIGRKIRITPTPAGVYSLRVFYQRTPDRLVLPQGRVVAFNSVNNTVNVDTVGASISTDIDSLSAFVNVVDGQTGEIKATLQVQKIDNDNRLTFKSSPDRTEVLNRTVTGTLPTDLQNDDYLCEVEGTCVLYFDRPLRNMLFYHTMVDLSQKLGLPSDMYLRRLKDYEDRVISTWAGRETKLRIRQKSNRWGRGRRYVYPGSR